MEINQDLLEKVKTSNNEFRKLYDEHLTLKSRVEELNKMKFLTPEQEIEKKTIQKKKLQQKDRMNEIVGEYEASLH
ncbi:MAG: DUF465 domain-containing protein [Nitrospina sp.]|nr:MAG: DUF465 domain-containing protein [Nitrospina sp.]TDJ59219.1 MAG: DUF465 domain-containing protein [Nitrospina sp.]